MLTIVVPAVEAWDERIEEFVFLGQEQRLELEHSLVSLSRWESKWLKSFISNKHKSDEETMDYIRCMTLTPNVDPEVYKRLTRENIQQINDYIAAPMTATQFSSEGSGSRNRETVTAELIYYWMNALNIPLEWENRHLNQLITYIRVCNIKNQPPKKRSQTALLNEYAALNAARQKQFNSKG